MENGKKTQKCWPEKRRRGEVNLIGMVKFCDFKSILATSYETTLNSVAT